MKRKTAQGQKVYLNDNSMAEKEKERNGIISKQINYQLGTTWNKKEHN